MTDTFYDRPIKGTISHYTESPGEQHHPDDLINALDALISLPEVAKVRWTQYTPYFNDGEACVFGVNSAEVLLTVEANDEVDEEDDEYDDYDQTHWRSTYELHEYGEGDTWEERRANMKYEIKGVNTAHVENKLAALEEEMNYHEVILSDKFGDPAEVTYDGEKFVVEHYDHD